MIGSSQGALSFAARPPTGGSLYFKFMKLSCSFIDAVNDPLATPGSQDRRGQSMMGSISFILKAHNSLFAANFDGATYDIVALLRLVLAKGMHRPKDELLFSFQRAPCGNGRNSSRHFTIGGFEPRDDVDRDVFGHPRR
jgi:hypothetical protein